MSKRLTSSAPPPRRAVLLMCGTTVVSFSTAYWLPEVSIPCGCVAVGAGIYAMSRFLRQRFLVVEERRAVQATTVPTPRIPVEWEPQPPAIDSSRERIYVGEVVPRRRELTGNRRALPSADQRPALRG